MSPPKPRDGYSLLEMSVVLMLIGLLAAMSWTAGSAVLESTRRTQTSNKLDVIEDALMAFRAANNRLPCPADATLVTTVGNYGVEAANPGSCTGGAPAANQTDATNNVVEGAVPFRTLNIPAEFMYDGWGRKFVYAVNYNVTGTLSMLGQSMNDQGKITINDASGNARDSLIYSTTGGTYYPPASALYALISYGPDGHGGYLKTGARYSSGSTDADEQTNCHCNASAVETAYAAAYVQKDATSTFGDFVRYKDRWQLQTFDDANVSHLGMVTTLGTRIDGVNAGDKSGISVAIGDVNGDGIPDIIIGAYTANGQAGYTYVVFGTRTGFPNPLPLSSLNGVNGFRLDGVSAGDLAGASVAVGDINGDGIKDIIIGAPNANSNAGYTYVVFGGKMRKGGTPWAASQVLNTGGANLINGTDGFRLDGVTANDYSSNALTTGDMNGDGTTDIIIGAKGANSSAGYTYVVFGGTTRKGGTAWGSNTVLNTGGANIINGTDGFRLDGVTANDFSGYSVATGDVNGDGTADIIIGAFFANSHAGYTYIVFGGPTRKGGTAWPAVGNLVLNTGGANVINGTDGFRLDGVTADDFSGYSVATGDVNGDGIPDLIIGAWHANGTAGYTYVVFGGSTRKGGTAWGSNTVLNTGGANVINGTDGFRLDGVTAGDQSGSAVATGDINGDGTADVIIGAWQANLGGSTYVAYGHGANAAWPATSLLSTLK